MGVPNLTRVDARARAELLSVSGYEVELDLTDGGGKPGERTFRSRTTIRFTASRPGAATFVDVIADGFREVTLNGAGARHRRPTGRRTGWRCPTWPPTTCSSSTPTCSTRTPARACTGSSTRSTARSTSTRSSRPRTPSGCTRASTSPTSRRTFALTVTAPPHWEVVSNGGPRRSPRASAARRWSGSRTTPPLSPYVTALVAGPYHEVRRQPRRDRPRRLLPGLAGRAPRRRRALRWSPSRASTGIHRAFDYRYPFDKYDQLFVPEFNAGAMENAGCVTFLEDYVFRSKVTDYSYERRAETILHEMAHMWFGDLVTMRWWDDLWLNESFATFASVLAQAQATRLHLRLDDVRQRREDLGVPAGPAALDAPDRRRHRRRAGGRGQLRRHHVRQGRERAQAAGRVRGDRAVPAGDAASTSPSTSTATPRSPTCSAYSSEESGRDLSRWSKLWLETAGVNTLRPEFELDRTGRYTSFAILQSPAEPGPAEREGSQRDRESDRAVRGHSPA